MIVLQCPWCGPRNVTEFHSLGEVLDRPDPRKATRSEWRSYLYLRSNKAVRVHERWFHRAGCRRYFDAERDTRDNTVFSTWRLGQDSRGADS